MIELVHSRSDALGPMGFKALTMDQGQVRSAVASLEWDGPVTRMVACRYCDSSIPQTGCTCGIHACYSAGQVLDQYVQYRDRFLVLVEAQGTVILHEQGWRAEQCAVHAIVELYSGNIIKHMMHVRAARCLGDPALISLESAIDAVQLHQRSIR